MGYINEIFKENGYRVQGGGIILFVFGFLIQEIVLMAQGLEAIEITPLPYANIILFICAILMFLGLVWVVLGLAKRRQVSL